MTRNSRKNAFFTSFFEITQEILKSKFHSRENCILEENFTKSWCETGRHDLRTFLNRWNSQMEFYNTFRFWKISARVTILLSTILKADVDGLLNHENIKLLQRLCFFQNFRHTKKMQNMNLGWRICIVEFLCGNKHQKGIKNLYENLKTYVDNDIGAIWFTIEDFDVIQ